MTAKAHTKRRIAIVAAVLLEGVTYWIYSLSGGQFHFWLHLLTGAALGLAVATVIALLRGSSPAALGGAALAGHAWSALPDGAFVALGILHQRWMDVFALHISLHLIPVPLITMLVVLGCTAAAWALTASGHHRPAVGALVAGLAILTLAMALRAPIPQTLEEIREHPQIALRCTLTT